MDPLLGALVSHYRVLEQIGVGGMGVVYLAEDERLHRKVALKFIVPASAGDADAQRRLLREAQAASALDHPNIATVYEVGDFGDQLFIAMAYYQGETLRRRIERGPLSIAEVSSIAAHIADGLAVAHAEGVVHRDLKPANVFITATGQVKILDFGLAKVETATADTTVGMTKTGTTLGTLSYMSPEQARGEHVDQRTDMWAFGALLFEMCTGRQPFRGDSAFAVLTSLATDTPPPLKSLRPDAPVELAKLVDRALVKEPAKRTLTAGEARRVLTEYRDRVAVVAAPSRWRTLRRPVVAVPLVAAAITLAVVTTIYGQRFANTRWAKYTALPEIERLADQQNNIAAFDLAKQAEQYLPGDPDLAALWARIARPVSIDSEPAGAKVFYTRYGIDEAWREVGETPLKNVRLPLGLLRYKAEKPSLDTAEDVTPGVPFFSLSQSGQAPEGMVRAAPVRGPFSIYIFGLETPRVRFDGFWVDRYEVTNRQYKAFVDAGGYKRREWWVQPFTKDGKKLTFEQAIALFVDKTGRTGPASWELGNHPAGAADLPVTGVSWYEAAAFAASKGHALPTSYHWYWVASQGLTGFVIPLGNFNSSAPVAAAETRALHRFGAYGLAGNVKEWCFNEAPGNKRYILGGGWDEPPYLFRDTDARSPFDRGPNFGFRTVRYDEGDKTVAAVSTPLEPPSRSYASEKPASDAVFEAYRRLYTYDHTELAPRTESVDDTNPDWRLEKISFAAAYGQERMLIYLFLPKSSQPPFQTVLFMPGSGAWDQRTPPVLTNPQFAFLVRSGRAVAYPIYKGSFERSTSEYHGGDELKSTSLWRDYVIYFSKDIRRTIDYFTTRSELDPAKIGFFGFSRGAALSPMMIVPEPRIKVAALWIPGLYLEKILPEVDAINFSSRITIPVLQLNGRYDYNFPEESSSIPFFQALGTRPDHKRRVVYDTGHNLPPNEAIKETLDWFDKHLGQTK
jgi:dienelactone hydrolase